ncbi:MAG TPA: type II toxin-antitoxin system RelE/ParE family toxin [Bryobacteraceae bacterium]|nr:type II toxin-antitoxin system RelE/ParE family toxin [Bryobacteraceae bacterium]
MNRFELARRALGDLQEIWEFVSEDSFTAADRLLEEFYVTFGQLAEMPGMGHKREDLTHRKVLFWALHSYLIIYKNSQPLRVVRVIHAKRDVKRLLTK